MKTLAVICIVKNEERYLATALQSVKDLANEIIVVDSGSTDATVTIAKHFTDKVFEHDWLGYGPQKNFALEKTDCDFILQIDADEEITPALKNELRAILEAPQFNFYWLKIITVFLGHPLKHLSGNNLRFFSREHAQWNDSLVHEQVVRKNDNTRIQFGDADSGRTKNSILHHSHYQTIAGYKERQEKYSTADAKQMVATRKDRAGKPVSVNPSNVFSRVIFLHERALKQFLRKFIRQKGFLDGWQGWLWCYFSAQYEYKMCKKYLTLIKQK